ncbi:MarR family winged helix-turn-helix transcriptional regulator [Actinoplanes regularis]|uniref:DNA-binding transcriptional regulator, MarR family n=1 Tax=Actinoplanes regularis TaxID=52697 RepID=A0A239K2A3_9ACTN|nr:MarR family transcriptional regulator [Actinoplanes regularis]GIE92388.1 MarR family transcriptional regulator [Actinoplanes regularis]SNT12516.1 DNA-binding transcriptional regulator, MarR family [Actinoplanes regularis]
MPDVTHLAAELRLVVGQLARRVRADDPTPPGVTAVIGLLGRQGPMTTSDLAAARQVRPQSMARTVSQLVEQGLAERGTHPVDGRKAPIALTPAGHAVLERERTRRADWLARAIEDTLSTGDQTALAHAVDLLRRLLEQDPAITGGDHGERA